MPCTLSAYGMDFDVDRFLEHTTLHFDSVWRRGEPILPRSKPHDSPSKTSGVRLEIGDQNEFDNLQPQVEAAIEFLRANETELRRLGEAVGEKWFVLTMGLRWRDDVAVFTDGIPPDLCHLAGRVGCWISIDHYWMEEGKPTKLPEKGRAPE